MKIGSRSRDRFGGLPQSFREPLILCYLDGLTQEQAAAQLHCPLGTIQSRLARAGEVEGQAREARCLSLGGVFGREPPCPAILPCSAGLGRRDRETCDADFGLSKLHALPYRG